jgi:hypothetical protein
VPATQPTGIVAVKVLIQLKQNTGKQLKGQFMQMPVGTAQLNISPTAPAAFTPAAPAGPAGSGGGSVLAASLYVDTVAGTGPVGVAKRPVGCSQANVFKRGEQVVVRSWGTDLATTDVLSSDNVNTAHVSIAGVPDVTLNWGAHGTVGSQVYFWSAPWIIPATYPLGETTLHLVFTLEGGGTATYDYTINVIPS